MSPAKVLSPGLPVLSTNGMRTTLNGEQWQLRTGKTPLPDEIPSVVRAVTTRIQQPVGKDPSVMVLDP